MIKNKIKEKDFTISYRDAIELAGWINVTYHWAKISGGKNELHFVTIDDYDVELKVIDD